MIIRLSRDEPAYEERLTTHSDGYVFNHLGGADAGLNLLHCASCATLRPMSDAGRRTLVPKWCCTRYLELAGELAARVAPPGWQQGAVCGG